MNPTTLNPVEAGRDLAYISRELDHLRDGLKLLGVKQCSCCRKYFKSPDGRNLFNAGDLVCYRCVVGWWQQRSPSITVEERKVIEHQLLRWLATYYEAKVIRRLNQLPAAKDIEVKIVVGCEQCDGTGQIGAARCQNCDGRGSEWVVVINPQHSGGPGN